MCRRVNGYPAAEEPVINYRHDNDAATDPNESGKQTSATTSNNAHEN
jgi:hypothetical protein